MSYAKLEDFIKNPDLYCEICHIKLPKKNQHYRLCKRCQPAYYKGCEDGRENLKAKILGILFPERT